MIPDLESAIARRNFAYEVVRNSMRGATLVDGQYVIPKRTYHRWQNVLTAAGLDEPDAELDREMKKAGYPYDLDGDVEGNELVSDIGYGHRRYNRVYLVKLVTFFGALLWPTVSAAGWGA